MINFEFDPSVPPSSCSLYMLIDELQICRGEFTYGDLAASVASRLCIPLLVAQRSLLQFIAMHGEDGETHMIEEPPPPTIAETIAAWRAMAAALKPTSMRSATARLWYGPRNVAVHVEMFECYRPRRSPAKWLHGAPDHVMACYDAGERIPQRYAVMLGGELWTAEYAHANWQAGLDPRLVPCLRMSDDPGGGSNWTDCLYTRRLGRKICWHELPAAVQSHVEQRTKYTRPKT